MNPILDVIDPTLRNLPGGSTGSNGPDMINGAASSRNTSRLPLASPAPCLTRTIRKFSKADIDSWAASNYAPQRDRNERCLEYEETHISRKNPLSEACEKLQLKVPKSASLDRLRAELSKHWFTTLPNHMPENYTRHPPPAPKRFTKQCATDVHNVLVSVPKQNRCISLRQLGLFLQFPRMVAGSYAEVFPSSILQYPMASLHLRQLHTMSGPSNSCTDTTAHLTTEAPIQPPLAPSGLPPSAIPHTPTWNEGLAAHHDSSAVSPLIEIPPLQERNGVEEESEAALLHAYNVAGENAYEMLGYDDNDESDDEHEGDRGGDDDDDEEGPQDMEPFRLGVCVTAVKRFEANQRAGGRKTQAAMVKAWNEFVGIARKTGKIPDDIVDEHSLLLFIVFCAERPKQTRKGFDIPGTFIGASQLQKLFFGALRIRKEQDAADPSLAKKCPATSVIVYDSIKTRMDEALEWEQNGLML
ncbi:hypothetical protein B0H19DRAFT_1267814 [Mycena capillaripes]|nr:hypothetical protein B0H19DRAFT_1267814 [Mycena capillaripes]